MLSRKCQLSRVRRLPPVHEQIALQCAKSICKMAVDLPKPTIPTGHVPVLVELKRTDDSSVYYYQVNVSADYHMDDEDDMDFTTFIGEISNLKQWLDMGTPMTELKDVPPPCPMHGRRSVGGAATTKSITSLSKSATNPQFVMTQSALHIVEKPEMKFISKENVATFIELPITNEADEQTKAHFMASLYRQHSSPLDYAELWLPQQDKCWAVQGYVPPPLEIAELYLDENNEYVEKVVTPKPLKQSAPSLPPLPQPIPIKPPLLTCQPKAVSKFPLKIHTEQRAAPKPPQPTAPTAPPSRSVNGYKMDEQITPKTAELCLNQNGDYVPHLNGFKYTHSKIRRLNDYAKPQKPIASSMPAIKNGYKASIDPFDATHHYQPDRIIHIERSPKYMDTNSFAVHSRQPTASATVQHQHQVPLLNHHYEHEHRHHNHHNGTHHGDELKYEQHPERLATKRVTTLHMQDMMAPDANYPLELQTLFRWNYCDLCRTAMRTVRNAVDHYSSRAHDRRVGSWLMRHCFDQANAPDDVLRYRRDTDPAGYYCDICDLKLTSKMHAQQHLFGRRHHLVAHHISKPNGVGYYDDQGRWVRTDSKWLMCELCDVSITSESQMAMHLSGARHRRRVHTNYSEVSLTLNGSHMYRISANGTLVPLNPFGCYLRHNGTCSGSGNGKGIGVGLSGMMRQHRLPLPPPSDSCSLSASYYCEVCNITLNHMKSVKQHEDGRMHNKKMQRVNIIQEAYA